MKKIKHKKDFLSLQEVVIAPSKAINRPDLGYLANFNMGKGNFGFVDFGDKAGDKMMGDQKLECELDPACRGDSLGSKWYFF